MRRFKYISLCSHMQSNSATYWGVHDLRYQDPSVELSLSERMNRLGNIAE